MSIRKPILTAAILVAMATLGFALPPSITLNNIDGRPEFFQVVPLGWSKTGKAAILVYQREETMEDTIASVSCVIINAVTDEVSVALKESVALGDPRREIDTFYTRFSSRIGAALTKAGIVLEKSPVAGAFPFKATAGNRFSGRLDPHYTPGAATTFWDRIASWTYSVRRSDGTEKFVVLVQKPKERLSGVAAMGYWKSPHENRLLSIIVFYNAAVESYRSVPIYYGSLLAKGFARPAVDPKEGEWFYEAVLEQAESPIVIGYQLQLGWPQGVFSATLSAEGYQLSFNAPLELLRTADSFEFRYLPPLDADEDPLADVYKPGEMLFKFKRGAAPDRPLTVFGALITPANASGDEGLFFEPVK